MKICRRLVGIALCCFVVQTEAWANYFCGTVSQIITETNQPGQFAGDQVIGWYEYESATIDGVFGTLQYCDFTNNEASPTLNGSVFGFFGWTQDGWLPFQETGFRAQTHLVVTDGHVIGFSAAGQIGGGDYGFRFSDFNISNLDMLAGESYYTRGALIFGAPVPVPDNVVNTFFLMVIGFSGIALTKRFIVR